MLFCTYNFKSRELNGAMRMWLKSNIVMQVLKFQFALSFICSNKLKIIIIMVHQYSINKSRKSNKLTGFCPLSSYIFCNILYMYV